MKSESSEGTGRREFDYSTRWFVMDGHGIRGGDLRMEREEAYRKNEGKVHKMATRSKLETARVHIERRAAKE